MTTPLTHHSFATDDPEPADTTSRRLHELADEALRTLFDSATEPTPLLVLRSDRGIDDIRPLDEIDAVRALRGRVATDDVAMVAFVAPAHVTPVECCNAATDGVVCHVLDRDGASITIVRVDGTERTFGPTASPQTGRVPDSCRRILGLATAPPSAPMVDFVVASWLEIVLRHALVEPSMTWRGAVSLHPASPSLPAEPTAADVAEATIALGASLDWERFRSVIAAIGGFPFGDDAEETAAWMDAGMFSRWALDELGDPFSLLDLLDATLVPSVSERLWATVRLSTPDAP